MTPSLDAVTPGPAVALATPLGSTTSGQFFRQVAVQAVALGLVMGILGVIGDLVESMFKRAVNAKDSSGTIPGMGGLLDVFDSLFFVPAAMYLILPVFQP